MIYFGKSRQDDGSQQTVKEHLNVVSALAAQYGSAFGEEKPAGLCGILHDFGKYSPAFQEVLKGTRTGIDHAICGAAFLNGFHQKGYAAIIEAVAAHHTRLISQRDLDSTLTFILESDGVVTTASGKQSALCGVSAYQTAGQALAADFPQFRLPSAKGLLPDGISSCEVARMLYTRMLFSCLVDADYTASGGYIQETESPLNIAAALARLYSYYRSLQTDSQADPTLNQFRTLLFERCGEAASQEGGIFTLTAPTGMGKTLALLHFALRHCQYTGKGKIIVILPFLSLIEQSARVYREILPHVLEDHSQSNLPDELREHAARWDDHFLITTSVRFFESLFSDCPTDCRKLHRLANSVILFDEAQSLPVSLLRPTLKAIQELCTRYGCTVVFSTATQPDYTKVQDICWESREILQEFPLFYQNQRRTEVRWDIDRGTPLAEIARQMAQQSNSCAIVNLRSHARKLYLHLSELCPEEELFLLSTDLCPAHRTHQIQTIRHRQTHGLPCRVVATQCIEAGVDLDFDQLYRALAPLEAIIQAAGRCNRNGTCPDAQVVVFVPEEEGRLYPDDFYGNGATLVRSMHSSRPLDIHNPEDIRRYYGQLLGTFRGDSKSIQLEKAISERDFEQVAHLYRLIDRQGVQIIVPYGPMRDTYEQIKTEALQQGLSKALLRQAAPLIVTSYDRTLVEQFCEPLYVRTGKNHVLQASSYYILLTGQESCYKDDTGFSPLTSRNEQNFFF